MAVILFVIATSMTATMAWFTDEATIEPNIFEAGTLSIEAGESWEEGQMVENWNPGDCEEKEVNVEITGTKSAHLRMQFDDGWYEYEDDEWEEWTHSEGVDPITVKVGEEVFPTDDWEEIGDWYYYVGGEEDGFLDPEETVNVISEVCLDGPKADNEFQGKRYEISFNFEALQTSNYAAYNEWGVELFEVPEED